MRHFLSVLLALGLASGFAGCTQAEDHDRRAGLSTEDPGPPPRDQQLDCSERGPVPDVNVLFDCSCVTVWSCKDLSNVVLEGENGDRERFEGLDGDRATFCWRDGERLETVWVKSGRNHSGDGPGYGERFDAPDDDDRCEDADAGVVAPPTGTPINPFSQPDAGTPSSPTPPPGGNLI